MEISETITLQTNMRVQVEGNIDGGTEFATKLLEIGEGKTQKINGTNKIKIAENLEHETRSAVGRAAGGCSLNI